MLESSERLSQHATAELATISRVYSRCTDDGAHACVGPAPTNQTGYECLQRCTPDTPLQRRRQPQVARHPLVEVEVEVMDRPSDDLQVGALSLHPAKLVDLEQPFVTLKVWGFG